MGRLQEHPRQMIAFHINPPEVPTHSVPTHEKGVKKNVLSAHIHKGSLMASRGTWGPSPQTETFHRPTGRVEKSLEKNIKSEREREKHGEIEEEGWGEVKAREREGMSSS